MLAYIVGTQHACIVYKPSFSKFKWPEFKQQEQNGYQDLSGHDGGRENCVDTEKENELQKSEGVAVENKILWGSRRK